MVSVMMYGSEIQVLSAKNVKYIRLTCHDRAGEIGSKREMTDDRDILP